MRGVGKGSVEKLIKGLELLEVVDNESFLKLASQGLKEVSVVCATEADWGCCSLSLLKIILTAPFCGSSDYACCGVAISWGGAPCPKIVTRKESHHMVIRGLLLS